MTTALEHNASADREVPVVMTVPVTFCVKKGFLSKVLPYDYGLVTVPTLTALTLFEH